jgi:hypothetical protein
MISRTELIALCKGLLYTLLPPDDPSGRTMALGLTQPLTEMSTSNISWGPPGTLGACQGL